MLKVIYSNCAKQIVDRFKERDDNVKIAILQAFSTLMKSQIVSEHTQSIELELAHAPSLQRTRSHTDDLSDLLPTIIGQFKKYLKSKNNKVRVQVMSTFCELAHTLHS